MNERLIDTVGVAAIIGLFLFGASLPVWAVVPMAVVAVLYAAYYFTAP